jgi:hypothetical protein
LRQLALTPAENVMLKEEKIYLAIINRESIDVQDQGLVDTAVKLFQK